MSFQDDVNDADFRDDPVVFTREATSIVITTFDGEHLQTIELPEVRLRRSEVSPEWLAMVEAERAQEKDSK